MSTLQTTSGRVANRRRSNPPTSRHGRTPRPNTRNSGAPITEGVTDYRAHVQETIINLLAREMRKRHPLEHRVAGLAMALHLVRASKVKPTKAGAQRLLYMVSKIARAKRGEIMSITEDLLRPLCLKRGRIQKAVENVQPTVQALGHQPIARIKFKQRVHKRRLVYEITG